ncbi:MAG: ribonuclease HII [Bacteroidota bacterium]
MLESFHKPGIIEAGCDEAGRGALAGPVFAAAVILPEGYTHPILNDSKQISKKQRDYLRGEIEEKALAWAVAMIDNDEIDRINILKSSIKAMHCALDRLSLRPDEILIDGNRFFPYRTIPHHCFVKGDGRFSSIAAASVLAKTHRDEFMEKIDREYPVYHWRQNMGYPTAEHRKAIAAAGVSPYHRKTFRLLDEQLSLDFLVPGDLL